MSDPTTYEHLSVSYDAAAARYRQDDEIEIRSENHRRLCGNLRRLCLSFARKIDVLDAGCGTGRHFHCLRQVRLLVGVDISAEMLRAARSPVRIAEITADEIRLERGNLLERSYPGGNFDLIYSLGVFGHVTRFDAEVSRKFHDWLRPGGRLYFNAIETAVDPAWVAIRKRIRAAVYPMFSRKIQARLDARAARFPLVQMSCDELEGVLHEGGFSHFTISTNVCRSPLWQGVHLECVAQK